jgi:hypothetical protein
MTMLAESVDERWLSPAEVARIIGRDPGDLLSLGYIRAEWVDGEYRIRPADVAAYMVGQRDRH